MGYIPPASYSYYSQYQERIQQPRRLAVSRVGQLQKINRFENQYDSAVSDGKRFSDYMGRYIDKKI